MNKLFVSVLLLVISFSSAKICPVNKLVSNIEIKKNYRGLINNKLNVVFHLEKKGDIILGFYYYENIGIDIQLKGKIINDSYEIYEFNYKNNKSAFIKGKLNNSFFTGEWISLSTKKKFPIELEEIEFNIIPLPKSICGKYETNEEQGGCPMTLLILNNKGDLNYILTTINESYKGKISITRELEIENTKIYIKLEGIQWAEYKGDISKDESINEDIQGRPVGIDGLLNENEIIIQNYGNAMNYYVKFQECSQKYIYLIKK